MSSALLQNAAEATIRRCDRMTRLCARVARLFNLSKRSTKGCRRRQRRSEKWPRHHAARRCLAFAVREARRRTPHRSCRSPYRELHEKRQEQPRCSNLLTSISMPLRFRKGREQFSRKPLQPTGLHLRSFCYLKCYEKRSSGCL